MPAKCPVGDLASPCMHTLFTELQPGRCHTTRGVRPRRRTLAAHSLIRLGIILSHASHAPQWGVSAHAAHVVRTTQVLFWPSQVVVRVPAALEQCPFAE